MTPIFIARECRPRAPRRCARAALPPPYSSGRSPAGGGASSAARAASRSRPTSVFQPASTVSTHSVVSRSVTHRTPEQIGLLLHPARVREHRARVHRQAHEVQVAQRRQQLHGLCRVQARAQAELLQPRGGARVQRQHAPARNRLQQGDEAFQPRRVVHVARPVGGGQHVPAGLEPVVGERARALPRDRAERQRHVGHHVADEVALPGGVLALEVVHRRRGRAQQQVAGVVAQHPVELLGHRPVERAHAGLHVRDRHVRLRGRERGASVELVSP